ncbi:hypothetical protein GCM10011514_07240 [Emticicia aquatilis]|uniref:RteC protein n=1 Tax=Emticicia aquatilis TaxID=1537369 RepID=A0A916YHJ1_9BACT|nr:hypothetical protein GCM10011514_07240 [Emticicia aquatilis]
MIEELNIIDEENQIHKSLKAINVCQKFLKKLKVHIQNNPFKNIEEEISFFKTTKPKFLSQLIFHVECYHIEFKKPPINNELIKEYYLKEIKKIYRFIKDNDEIYNYLRSEGNAFDQQFFVRRHESDELSLELSFALITHSQRHWILKSQKFLLMSC